MFSIAYRLIIENKGLTVAAVWQITNRSIVDINTLIFYDIFALRIASNPSG
jgi:hypothetical protein